MIILINDRLKKLRNEKNLTQRELAKLLKLSPSTIAMYETGQRMPDPETLQKIADFFGVSVDYLLGRSDIPNPGKLGIIPVGETIKVPVIGVIRAGEPILAEENIIGYEDIPAELAKTGEFFFLKVTGDSMINARIYENDLVLIRKQSDVDDGDIAVVLIENENATLKRIFKNNGTMILHPENPKYKPRIIINEDVKIIGKAIEVRHKL